MAETLRRFLSLTVYVMSRATAMLVCIVACFGIVMSMDWVRDLLLPWLGSWAYSAVIVLVAGALALIVLGTLDIENRLEKKWW